MLEGCGGALEAWDRVAGGLRVSSPSREGDHTPSLSWNSSVLTVTGNCSDRPSGPFSILWWQRLASSELVSHPSAGTQLPEDVQRRVTGASLGSAPGGPSPTPSPSCRVRVHGWQAPLQRKQRPACRSAALLNLVLI